jgi:hypothetical protein
MKELQDLQAVHAISVAEHGGDKDVRKHLAKSRAALRRRNRADARRDDEEGAERSYGVVRASDIWDAYLERKRNANQED